MVIFSPFIVAGVSQTVPSRDSTRPYSCTRTLPFLDLVIVGYVSVRCRSSYSRLSLSVWVWIEPWVSGQILIYISGLRQESTYYRSMVYRARSQPPELQSKRNPPYSKAYLTDYGPLTLRGLLSPTPPVTTAANDSCVAQALQSPTLPDHQDTPTEEELHYNSSIIF